MTKVSIVKKALESQGVHPSQVSRNKAGHIIVRKGYYYHLGASGESWGNRVKTALQAQGVAYTVIDVYDHFTSFNAGAPVAKQSHFGIILDIQ